MNNARQLTEGAMLAGIYLVLLLIATFAPVISLLAMLAMPVPIILYWIRHGFKPGIYFSIVILLLSFIGTLAGFFLTISIVIGAAATGYSLHHKQSTYEALLKGAAGYALGFTIFLAGTQFISGINMIDEIQNSYQATLQSLQSEMDTVGVGVTDAQWEQVNAMFDYIMVLIPTMIAVFSLLYAFITQWLAQKIHNRQSKDKILYPPFRRFNLPVIVLFIYFIGSFARWFDIDPSGWFYPIVANVTELAGILLVLQGFSFFFYFAHHRKLPKVLPILAVILSVLFGTVLLYLVRILGIIDVGFRLRERMSSKK
ncbi:YybS family protein [Terribacillus saccharophilus]|uniref:YybS family protein n=1 Tax=Terribacillus saccharophilus TaxID=361277 RepID=UPI002DCDA346|nr:YybS family protein [Terribacillus saccharophilus]